MHINVIVPLVTTYLSQNYCPTFLPRKRDCYEKGVCILVVADMSCQIPAFVCNVTLVFVYHHVQIQWRCRAVRRDTLMTKRLDWYVGKNLPLCYRSQGEMLSVLRPMFATPMLSPNGTQCFRMFCFYTPFISSYKDCMSGSRGEGS